MLLLVYYISSFIYPVEWAPVWFNQKDSVINHRYFLCNVCYLFPSTSQGSINKHHALPWIILSSEVCFFLLVYPQLRLLTLTASHFNIYIHLCCTCEIAKTSKTVYSVEIEGSSFEDIIFYNILVRTLLCCFIWERQDWAVYFWKELEGGKLCFPVSHQRTGRICFCYVNSRAQTERYKLKNEK